MTVLSDWVKNALTKYQIKPSSRNKAKAFPLFVKTHGNTVHSHEYYRIRAKPQPQWRPFLHYMPT